MSVRSKKNTINERIHNYTKENLSEIKAMDEIFSTPVFLYVFLAILLHYQEIYGEKIDICFSCIKRNDVPCHFLQLGIFFIFPDPVNPDIVEKCSEIIVTSIKEIVIFPVQLETISFRHLNLLVFRNVTRKGNKHYFLEWYEPHGQYFCSCEYDVHVHLALFTENLKRDLTMKLKKGTFHTFLPNQTCKVKDGPQYWECKFREIHDAKTSEGMCVVWCLIFIEQIIKSPNVTAKSLMNRLYNNHYPKETETAFYTLVLAFLKKINIFLFNNFDLSLEILKKNWDLLRFFMNHTTDEFLKLRTDIYYSNTNHKILLFLNFIRERLFKINLSTPLKRFPNDFSSINTDEMDSNPSLSIMDEEMKEEEEEEEEEEEKEKEVEEEKEKVEKKEEKTEDKIGGQQRKNIKKGGRHKTRKNRTYFSIKKSTKINIKKKTIKKSNQKKR